LIKRITTRTRHIADQAASGVHRPSLNFRQQAYFNSVASVFEDKSKTMKMWRSTLPGGCGQFTGLVTPTGSFYTGSATVTLSEFHAQPVSSALAPLVDAVLLAVILAVVAGTRYLPRRSRVPIVRLTLCDQKPLVKTSLLNAQISQN
jgi:hypothetical protein